METYRNDVKSGLFILIAILMFLAGLFQVGGIWAKFQPGRDITLAFENSMRVEEGSEVLYRGKEIGRVTRIEFADAGDAVRIVCSVDPEVVLYRDSTARIDDKSALGGKVIEIFPPAIERSEMQVLSDNDLIQGMPPGGLSAMVANMNGILADLRARGGVVINQFSELLTEVDATLGMAKGEIQKVTDVMPNVNATLDEYRNLAGSIDEKLGSLTTTLENTAGELTPAAKQTLGEFEQLAAQLRTDIDSMQGQINQLMGETQGLVTDTRGLLSTNREELETTLVTLRKTLENMEELTAILKDRPNAVIFGKRKED